MITRAAAFVGVAALALASWAGVSSASSASGASARSGSLRGAFDSVSARFDANWEVSGWAVDTGALSRPVEVRLYVGTRFVANVGTGDPRPDIPSAVPGAGPTTGWHATITAADLAAAGANPVCAYAIDAPSGPNLLLGCHRLPTSGNSVYNPIGVLDVAAASPGLLRLKGWAGDVDGDPKTKLRIYIDGALHVEATAALPRPDVRQALGLSPTTGFDITLPMRPGPHFVCVYAQNTGRAGLQNSTVGCATRSIPDVQPAGPHDPVGLLEGTESTDTSPGGIHWAPSGWAYDPDTAGPISVRVRVIGYKPTAPRFVKDSGDITTGAPRPDVQAGFPAAGPNAGFITDGLGGAPNSPSQPYWMCVYALNVGPGTGRFLGCIEWFASTPLSR